MKTYYKSYGVTASIQDNTNGTATLTTCCANKKTVKQYSSRKAALAAWRRMCN